MTLDDVRTRCAAQALMPGGQQWKTCIREAGHTEQEPHVWLESLDVLGRRPILVTWFGPRATEPTVSAVVVPATETIEWIEVDGEGWR